MEQINDRRDVMLETLQGCMEETFYQSCKEIQSQLEENGENIWDEFKSVIHDVLQRAKESNGQGKKGNIKYLAFCFLKSGIRSGCLEWYIETFDDGFYLDTNETGRYYRPAFLRDRYAQDLDRIFKALGREFVRIQNYEWDRVKEAYAGYYDELMFHMAGSLKEMILEEITGSGIGMADKFKILYGGYMDKADVLYEE